MRARTAFLAAALCLSACTEGVSPLALVGRGDTEEQPPGSLPATDVLADGPESARQPPPQEIEPAPAVIPVTGSAAVVGLEEGSRGLSSVPQVDVDLTVNGVRGRGTVEVEFVSPAGHPYERRSSVVEAQPDVARTVRFSLPVAGTTVATTGMSGTWQVRFFLDGEPLTSAAFTLEP
ncbi:hypothetical protein [Pyxidicoccus sp. MSG2]|uniref:hypothetical protein n=1 Tax=Pyxidicoccus sp. MSG2 TaxID=2996790 RepID=UPI002270456E|nr:hypothetical protein [Pyxidicoccus sp. MSG2]MCY1023143.1 hypothetical protein [Pyxidicoccus sp. MSG2]